MSDEPFADVKRIGEITGNGVFIFDDHSKRFLYANAALVRILELPPSLLADDPNLIVLSLSPEEVEYLSVRYDELMQRRVCENVTFRMVRRGIGKYFSIDAYRVQESFLIGMVKDITQERRHEEYLINYGARKDTLLDMVAQKLSTPLNLTNFTMDLVEKAVKEQKFQRIEGHVQVIREVTSECITVINDLLIEEHLESRSIEPKINRFDIIDKTKVVLEGFMGMHPDRHFSLSSSWKHLFVGGDDLKYFQIVHNLLSNSIKFSRPGASINVGIIAGDDYVEVFIKDNGIGIPKSLQPRIFEKRTTASRPGLNGEEPNGIGLYVVRELTRLLRGELTFTSEENVGSEFRIRLPKY